MCLHFFSFYDFFSGFYNPSSSLQWQNSHLGCRWSLVQARSFFGPFDTFHSVTGGRHLCEWYRSPHGIPASLISDRDPVFMSQFWRELFCLQGTQLSMSSAYHPQLDGQTEIVHRYLEDYLRCFTSDHPKQWFRLLVWAKWHYNTAFHSSIQMSPYEAVYGRPPPTLLDYVGTNTTVEAVHSLLSDHTQALLNLKENLVRAQHHIKQQADAKQTDTSFQAGDWVFLKLQLYRQRSLTK